MTGAPTIGAIATALTTNGVITGEIVSIDTHPASAFDTYLLHVDNDCRIVVYLDEIETIQ